jgi:integrase
LSYEGLRLTQPQAASLLYVPSIGLRQSALSPLQPILSIPSANRAGDTDRMQRHNASMSLRQPRWDPRAKWTLIFHRGFFLARKCRLYKRPDRSCVLPQTAYVFPVWRHSKRNFNTLLLSRYRGPLTHVRQVRKRAVEPEILEPAEIAAVLRELGGMEPIRTAFLIAAVMGMRRGEIFGLKWADVNFERALMYVRRSYVDGVAGPPKTETSRRALPVPQQSLEALQGWRAKSSFREPGDWIFASGISFGKQPSWPGSLWRRNVVPAIGRAGITKPYLGWHTHRRSYVSLLLSSGISLRVSLELMRHSAPEMTLGLYAQTVGEEKRDAGRMVASLVMGDATQK